MLTRNDRTKKMYSPTRKARQRYLERQKVYTRADAAREAILLLRGIVVAQFVVIVALLAIILLNL